MQNYWYFVHPTLVDLDYGLDPRGRSVLELMKTSRRMEGQNNRFESSRALHYSQPYHMILPPINVSRVKTLLSLRSGLAIIRGFPWRISLRLQL